MSTSNIEAQLAQLEANARRQIDDATASAQLEAVRRTLLGKKGELTQLLRGMGGLSPEERPRVGQFVNEAKQRLEAALDERAEELMRAARNAALASETIDVTLPAPELPFG
ncbi:MAG TPA: phenylalanine--tRNA ligase subunit alpha, partial [Abditibacteriaceae bacterium]|nr:phenylalanine--tRNA ligase subunit alpha [Abditibacteriaceae bacterium]